MSTESLLSGDLVVADGADTLALVQVTDTHLTGTETGSLLGMNTARSAKGVIDAALATESADCILVTGDIAADGQPKLTDSLKPYLALRCPAFGCQATMTMCLAIKIVMRRI